MIKLAQPSDLAAVMLFYDQLITDLATTEFPSDWHKGVYPDSTYVQEAIARGELFINWCEQQIISAMVLNGVANEGYAQAPWQVADDGSNILLIHTLGVAAAVQGQKIAQTMVRFAIKQARQQHKAALHLDAVATNIPAQKLYAASGFTHVVTLKLFYADTGVTDFLLYELVL
ncbi:GNAT family N-acetyltransferase [Loigolactobacillus jiayinensis]|uniref:GNAT family N-acetyltransferase n=1 Tax=Loigolactobacillus jiayinensis TaxID=2486016 RepID=A0ABW1RI56_9LACO|nr:GNAT family N-acetyltransferase [Loigolactobacillus jiayinensis]